MVNTQGLAVGLAIGIPSLIIIVVCVFIWYRNQRKQNKEDRSDDEVDMDLRDNHLFSEFQEELHRPLDRRSNHNIIGENLEEKVFASVSSSHGSTLSTNVTDNRTGSNKGTSPFPQHPHMLHSKTPSAYDFYDTVIPVLPTTGVKNGSTIAGDTGLMQPPHIGGDAMSSSNHSSAVSIDGSGSSPKKDRSLDSFAKQLNSPACFEKLPSRATSSYLKQRPITHYQLSNSSSTDGFQVRYGSDTKINEHYVHESISHDNPQPHPYSQLKGTKNDERAPVSKVLGGGVDRAFDAEGESDSEPAVVFK